MRLFVLVGAAMLCGCNATSPNVDNEASMVNEGASVSKLVAQPVHIKAVDGVTVYAMYYPSEQPKALILLFHQAGSSKAEYATIAPQLQAAGYAALAIDQRSGGSLFGQNQTVAGIRGMPQGEEVDYLSALPDVEAALAWGKANGNGKPIILWGSSYSASLVFLLAASSSAKDSVKAVVAFSPGEYFSDKKMVEKAAAKIAVPVFVDQASDKGEIAEGKAIISATMSTDRQQYIPATGIHGSSTLNSSKNPAGAAENWRAVLGFLKRVVP